MSTFTQATNLAVEDIRRMFRIGEHCRVMKAEVNNFNSFYRMKKDKTAMVMILMPSGWKLQAESRDMTFMISAHKIYHYNSGDFMFKPIFTFPSPSLRYKIQSNGDRLVVSAAVSKKVGGSVSAPVN